MKRAARTGTTALALLALTAGAPHLAPAAAVPGAAPASGTAAVPPGAAAPAVPLPPLNPVDPGVKGPYRTVSGAYTLPPLRIPGLAEPAEVTAHVVGPKGAPGSRPLVLFMHGSTIACADPVTGYPGGWPCPPGMTPVPAHRGYRHTQELLASQGYVTVSVSAHAVDIGADLTDDRGAAARSAVIRHHLARWADWSRDRTGAPAVIRAAAKADPGKVLLVGHSTAGPGINRAALDTYHPSPSAQDGYQGPARWKIRGIALLGPSSPGQNPVPDVPSMTVLPGCEGIVHDLPGQSQVDAARLTGSGKALHSAVYLAGANSNFFNSELTPGQAAVPGAAWDDFQEDGVVDAVCNPRATTRLTAKRQQTAGSTYIAAAARLFVAGDDKARPLLDGSHRRAASAGAARAFAHAVGGNRTPAVVPSASTRVTGAGRLCDQVHTDPARVCLEYGTGSSPHFQQFETVERERARRAVALRWTRTGTPVRVSPARAFSLRGAQRLALRIAVPPRTTGTALDIAVTDTAGRRATLGRARLDGLTASIRTAGHWAQEVRVPLTPAARAGVNLKRVASVELIPRTRSGKAWLLDAWGWRPGTPSAAPVTGSLPRVDLGRTVVTEGDSGTRTHRVPVRVAGHGTGRLQVYVYHHPDQLVARYVATVRAGSGTTLEIPVAVTGDTLPGYDRQIHVFVKSAGVTVVGAHRGGLTVREDDGTP